MATVEELEERLHAMREEIREIKAQLSAEANLRSGPMRDTRRCPACRGTKILLVEELRDSSSGTLASWTNVWGTKRAGTLQIFACASCGHAELHLDNVAELEGKKGVRVLESFVSTGGGPFR